METVAVPVFVLVGVIGFALGVLLGWFSGRQYQRRREEGMERPAIIEDTKAKILAELQKAREKAVAEVHDIEAKIKAL
jgi:uncharacterized protein YneF (UPF0154 family)